MSIYDDDYDDDDDNGEMMRPMACQICGDEYEAGSLKECETCNWLMCESCEREQGNCYDCSLELGLIDENE